jgi:hypothetical protein
MIITDIMAAVCSAVTFAGSFLYISFILRLPAMITDSSVRASERNIKLLILVTVIVIMLIALVKFVSSVWKLIYRISYNKKSAEEIKNGGFFTKSFVRGDDIGFRRFSLLLNFFVAFYALAMFLLAFPNRMYIVGAGRTAITVNEETHRIWEIRWFLPMLQFFLIMFAVSLLICILRYKIVSVKKEYTELYALTESRELCFVKCRACGFDNHMSSVNCGKCNSSLVAADILKKATAHVHASKNLDLRGRT